LGEEISMCAADSLAVHVRWTKAGDGHDVSHHAEFLHDDIEVVSPSAEPVVGIEGDLAMIEDLYAALRKGNGTDACRQPSAQSDIGRLPDIIADLATT
jgi:hypothetical protein